MKNKLITIFLALSFIITSVTFICLNTEVPENSLAANTTAEIPQLNNHFKTYKSNIPNVWYDENACFGIDKDNLSYEANYYLDFISPDQAINYANQKILTTSINQPIEFYLEIGAEFASPEVINQGFEYKISNQSSVFSLNVSLNYKNVDYILYDNSANSQELDFTGDLAGANKLFSLDYNFDTSNYDYETMTKNNDYRLMKFTITPIKVGADIFSIHFGEGQIKNVFVNVTDARGDGKIVPEIAQIETEIFLSNEYYSNSFSGNIFNGNLKDKNISLHKDFLYSISIFETPLVNEYSDYIYDFSNISCEIDSLKTNKEAQITKPQSDVVYLNLLSVGEYKIDAKSKITVSYVDYELLYQTETIEIDYSFNVYSYDKTSFTPKNFVEIDDNSNYLYPTEFEVNVNIPFINDSDNWTTNLTLNGEPNTIFNDATYLEEKSFVVSGKVIDNYLKSFLDNVIEEFSTTAGDIYAMYLPGPITGVEPEKTAYIESQRQLLSEQFAETYGYSPDVSYTAKTIRSESLLEKPTLEIAENLTNNEITIDLANQVNETALAIKNYEKLSNKSIVEASSNYSNLRFTNGVLYITDQNSVSTVDVSLSCDYGVYGKVFNSYKLNFINSNVKYSISKSIATISLDETLFLDVSVENNSAKSVDENEIKYTFISENNNVKAEVSSDSNLTITVNALNQGVDTLTIIAKYNDVTLFVQTVHVTIINKENIASDTRVDFVQGNNIQIYLSSLSNIIELQVDYPINPLCDGFNWISFNQSVVEIETLSSSSARIKALREGSTTVVAVAQLSDGTSVHAMATITVIASLPKIDITFSKQDVSAFNIYDSIEIGIDTHGFAFSNNFSANWTIDGEKVDDALSISGEKVKILSNTLSFYNKFGAGFHTVKAEITDNVYDFTVSCEKQINIAAETNQKRELSFNSSEINLVYTASKNDIYNSFVFLDGVLSNDYEYKWISSDASVLKIMSNGANVSIEPLKRGSATITVYCNVGNIDEENYISQNLQVNVDEIETIDFVSQNAYPKPGESIVIDILINGKSNYKNLNLPLTVTSNGAPCEFRTENGQIFVDNLQSGNLLLSTTFNGKSTNLSLSVTNVNFKKILTIALPYLVISALIACIILVVLRARSNPYKSIGKKINKLSDKINLATANIGKNKEEKVVIKEYKRLLRLINRLIAQLNYQFDEGHDESKAPLTHVLSIKKILLALIKTADKNYQQADKILTAISEKQIVELKKMYEEIMTSFKIYEQNIAEQNKLDVLEVKQKKASKSLDQQHEDQLALLKQQGLIDNDDA